MESQVSSAAILAEMIKVGKPFPDDFAAGGRSDSRQPCRVKEMRLSEVNEPRETTYKEKMGKRLPFGPLKFHEFS